VSATLEVTLSESAMDELAERIAAKLRETPNNKPLTPKQASDALGVSLSTIHIRVRAGLIRKIPDIGAIRIPRSEIRRLLAETE